MKETPLDVSLAIAAEKGCVCGANLCLVHYAEDQARGRREQRKQQRDIIAVENYMRYKQEERDARRATGEQRRAAEAGADTPVRTDDRRDQNRSGKPVQRADNRKR